MSSENPKQPDEITPEESLRRALAVDGERDSLLKRADKIGSEMHEMAVVATQVRDQHAKRLDGLSGELRETRARAEQLEEENRALREKLLAFERLHAGKP